MSRLRPNRQQGFGLLVFVIMASTIALSIILGYSGLLTRESANQYPAKLAAELNVAVMQIEGYYQKNAQAIDGATFAEYTADRLLAESSVSRRRNLKAAISNVLVGPSGVKYRRVALYFPSTTDELNPPNLALFATTGDMAWCTNAAAECSESIHVIFDSQKIHEDLKLETQRRLERVAFKAQAYFKARMLQDPEKNISVNYFRPPFGGNGDTGNPFDIPVVADYTSFTAAPASRIPGILGITGDELVTAWGDPVEVSNGKDSETTEAPYTMVFRAKNPFGGYFYVRAVQQI